MTQVTLELPPALAEQARSVAEHSQRPLESVLLDWLDRAANTTPISELTDEDVLALADLELSHNDQERLSNLLDDNQNGLLTAEQRAELDDLMNFYQDSMVRKAHALAVAVARGLRPRGDE
jgi:hypothetical protein